jgi:uncharacterized protein YjbI with pentapeptide repeats
MAKNAMKHRDFIWAVMSGERDFSGVTLEGDLTSHRSGGMLKKRVDFHDMVAYLGENGQGSSTEAFVFDEACLKGVNLTGLIAPSVQAQNTNLNDATLDGVDFSHGNFQGSQFRGASFIGANLRFSLVPDVDFSDANFQGAYLLFRKGSNATFCNVDFRGIESALIAFNSGVNQADFQGADFSGAIMDWFSKSGTRNNIKNADLRNAIFRGTTFGDYFEFEDCDLEGADFSGAIFPSKGPTFRDCYMGRTNMAGIDLVNAKFHGCCCPAIDLSGTNLTGSRIGGSLFTQGNFSGADLNHVEYTGNVGISPESVPADLRSVNLYGAVYDTRRINPSLGCNLLGKYFLVKERVEKTLAQS